MKNRTRRPLLFAGLTLLLYGCATAPRIGVRGGYENLQIRDVAVVPFYAVSSFGLDDEFHNEILIGYEQAVIEWLHARGAETMSPQEVRTTLEAAPDVDLESTLHWAQPLDGLFEEGDGLAQPTSLEAESVRRAGTQVRMPSLWLLGQVVYHSQGACWHEPRRVAGILVVNDGESSSPTSACVVAHFHARLVDSKTGKTVWFGRQLTELHAQPSAASNQKAIRSTVNATFAENENGLQRLLEGMSDGASQSHAADVGSATPSTPALNVPAESSSNGS